MRRWTSNGSKPMQPVSSTMWVSMTFLPLMPTWSRFKIDWHGCPIAKVSIKPVSYTHLSPVRLSAITAGGSQAVFFKVNTLGEESFLNDVKDLLEEILEE